MLKRMLLVLLGSLVCQPAFADVYVRSLGVSNMGENQTWYSGKKRREETVVNLGGGMPTGKILTITRIDKGVEWELDPDLKIYKEKTIALPKTEEKLPTSVEREAVQAPHKPWVELPKEEKDFCEPVLTVLPNKESIAGFAATGYQAKCPNTAVSTMWMAPPNGVLKTFEKDVEQFDKAFQDELYKNFSAAEKKMVKEFFGAFGQAGASMLLGIRPDKLPKHVPLRIEQTAEMGDGSVRTHRLIDIQEIRADKADASQFDIPAGYRKVTDQEFSDLQGQRMAEQMGVGGWMKDMAAYGNQMGITDQPASAPTPEPARDVQTSAEAYTAEPAEASMTPEEPAPTPETNDFDANSYVEENAGA